MAFFLNREGILNHFGRLFEEAKSEIIMIVPFIKLTNEIKDKLLLADKRGVEILLLYRENQMSVDQKEFLFSLENLTLLNHPNVHAKCYLNERSLIVCSMNLYETSIKNNREMGILLDYFNYASEGNNPFSSSDDSVPMGDAIEEISAVINSATIEKESIRVKSNGFQFNILKNRHDMLLTLIRDLNKELGNKRFSEKIYANGISNLICQNYFENVDLELEIEIGFDDKNLKVARVRFVALLLNHPDSQLKSLFKNFKSNLNEYRYENYKIYWNWHSSPIKIYRDRSFSDVWDDIENLKSIKVLIAGADKVLSDLKKEKLFIKII